MDLFVIEKFYIHIPQPFTQWGQLAGDGFSGELQGIQFSPGGQSEMPGSHNIGVVDLNPSLLQPLKDIVNAAIPRPLQIKRKMRSTIPLFYYHYSFYNDFNTYYILIVLNDYLWPTRAPRATPNIVIAYTTCRAYCTRAIIYNRVLLIKPIFTTTS